MMSLFSLLLGVLPVIGAQVFIEPGQRPEQIDAWFTTLEENGMNACRIRMFESYMRRPDGWDFSLFDTAFESAEKHGIGIWCTLFPATEKTDIGGWKFPRDAAQQRAFAEFIEALVTHYRSHPALRGWVQINEPGVHDIPDTPFVNAARERWNAEHPAKEYKENGYPVLMDLREDRFLSDLNRDFLAWIAAEVARYDPNHDIHVNPHAVFDLYAQHDFPAYREFLTSLGGSAHPAWHFGFFPREDYALAMMAESEILRSGAGELPWFMTEIQGGNNTYSGLNALCPTADEIRQWLWSVIGCEGRGGIFWMLNPRSSGIEAGEWAMIDFQGRPTGRLLAAAEVASALKGNRELFAGLREIPSGIDVVYLRESVWAERLMARKDDPMEARRPGGVTKSSLSCWRALTARGLNVGFKAFGEYDFSQDDYSGKTLILSHQICLPDACLAPLTHFVECGGTLIVEGLTGFFDEDLHCTMNTGFRYASLFGGEISEFILTPDRLWEGHFAGSKERIKVTAKGRGKVVWMPSSYALDAWIRRDWKPLSKRLMHYAALHPAAVSFRRGYRRGLLLRTLESPQGRVAICIDPSGKKRRPRLRGFSTRNASVLYEGGGVRVLLEQSN